jgi:hypothetical protein
MMESGGEERKVRGAIKKASWKRGYISRNPMLEKKNDEVP